jgi:hypothetical protein
MRSESRRVRGGDELAMRLLGIRQEPPSSRYSGMGLKAVVVALAGLAGLTAASAGISSLRRRQKEPKDAS